MLASLVPGFRCLHDFWCSDAYVKEHGDKAKLAVTLCKDVLDISAQLPADAYKLAREIKAAFVESQV